MHRSKRKLSEECNGLPPASKKWRIPVVTIVGAVASLLSVCGPVHAVPSSAVVRLAGFEGLAANLVYPVMGPRMSSDFGMRKHPKFKVTRHHHGIDLAAPSGAAIRAIAPGTVIYADPYAGYGNLIVVKHANGLTSHYGHCSHIKAHPGQKVNAGTVLGEVGSTGISTGPHLHFEIRLNGTPHDPEEFLPGLAAESEG